MIRRSWLLRLLLVLVLLLPATAYAADDPLVPGRPQEAPAYGSTPPLYDDPRFEPWDYTFEGQDWNRSDYTTIYFWMNQLQVGKAWALKMGIRTVEYAVRGDLVTPLINGAQLPLNRLADRLWNNANAPLVAGAMALAGIWALLLYLRGRTSRAWGALGGTVLILLLFALVSQGGTSALTGSVKLSRSLAVELFQNVEQATRGTKEADLIVRSGDAAWRALVHEPWVTGELSEQGRSTYRTPDGLDGGNFLAMSVPLRHSACLYNVGLGEQYCPWWGVDYIPRRMMLVGWTTVSGLAVAGVMTLLAGSIILSQLTLLFFLALAPVWLLAALWWPEGGMRLVRGVVMKTFSALVAQAMLAAVLAVWLSLISLVHDKLAATGWMLESVLLAGLAVLAFRYRFAWLTPIAAISERLVPQAATRAAERTERARRERGDQSVIRDMAPVFASIPEGILNAQPVSAPPDLRVVQQRPAEQERREGSSTTMTLFHRQVERMRQDLLLRERTIQHERAMEDHTDTPPPSAPRRTPARPVSKLPPLNQIAQGQKPPK